MTDPIGAAVLDFYRTGPFTAAGAADRQVVDVRAANQLEGQYADLHQVLTAPAVTSFLDVGCGAGWLCLTVDHWYGKGAHGIDFNPDVIARARDVATRMGSRATFAARDLFALSPDDATADVVCAVGVLHHTRDTREAIEVLSRLVAPGPQGRLYLGLYHRYGRQPFLDYFALLKEHGYDEDALLAAFAALHRGLRDPQRLRSWFHDQVLHPHERQHTLREVAGWLDQLGFVVETTSINRFAPIGDLRVLFELEKGLAEVSYRRNIVERRYFPGFFSVCARRQDRR
jgi:SAM-dependent methyltransferase